MYTIDDDNRELISQVKKALDALYSLDLAPPMTPSEVDMHTELENAFLRVIRYYASLIYIDGDPEPEVYTRKSTSKQKENLNV